MAGGQRDRQRKIRRARAAAAAAQARRREARRRWTVGVAIVLAVIVTAPVAVAVFSSGDDEAGAKKEPAVAEAVEAKPCVAVADPLPAGAPPVPVKLGPPPTALVTEDLKPGTGATVGPQDTVTAHYIGVACSTGKIFDSSYSRGQPVPFPLGNVIVGWQEGIPGMKVGGQRLLGIPPDKAYGPQGQGADIGPDETLWFVVEVVDSKAA